MGEDARRAARDRITEMYVERFGNVISEEKGAEMLRELLDDPETRPLVLQAFPEFEEPED